MRSRDLLARIGRMADDVTTAALMAKLDAASGGRPSKDELRALLARRFPRDVLPPENLPLCSWGGGDGWDGVGWVTPDGQCLPKDGTPGREYGHRDGVYGPIGVMAIPPDDDADLEFVRLKLSGQIHSPKTHRIWIWGRIDATWKRRMQAGKRSQTP